MQWRPIQVHHCWMSAVTSSDRQCGLQPGPREAGRGASDACQCGPGGQHLDGRPHPIASEKFYQLSPLVFTRLLEGEMGKGNSETLSGHLKAAENARDTMLCWRDTESYLIGDELVN